MTYTLNGDAQSAAAMDVEATILGIAKSPGHCSNGGWDRVFSLLDEYCIDPNTIICHQRGKSLLTLAAVQPAPEVCKRLLALNADPSLGGIASRSVLTTMVRARSGKWSSQHREIVAILAPRTINHQDHEGKTALMFAAMGVFGKKQGNLRILEQLMSFGADPFIRDRQGRTALMLAIESNDASKTSSNWDVVKVLESYSSDYTAAQWFAQRHKVVFSDSGEMTVLLREETKQPRAIRQDAQIGTIARKIEERFLLPEGSVALVDGKGKSMREHDTIGALRKKYKL
jgi:ankyrin repeat protein